MDPNKGPFTDIEWESVQQALNDAYARNGVSLQEYVLVWLFALLGLRPTQYARLKLCDVSVATSEKDGAFVYSIRVPRAKTREGNPRAQFADRVLIPQVGEVVLELTSQVEARFVGILDDPRQAPLFPLGHEGSAPIGFEYHATTEQIRNKLARVLNALKVVSERTGKPMNIMATRFRRTLGTRAAAEGHGELVIAELLDHSDTQNVGVYVNATPAIIERIDKAIAMRMAPLAQAFAGKLINGPAEATRATDSSSNISAPHITKSFKSIASCGMHGFCGFLKPVACYTCRSFEPWVDGPHEAVLDHLLAERERLLLTTDSRIASINDRTILAVAEVVHRCEQARREKDASHG